MKTKVALWFILSSLFSASMVAQPTVESLEISARGPNSIVLGMKSAASDTFAIELRTGSEEFASVSPEQSTLLDVMHFYLITGLEEGTSYDFKVYALDGSNQPGPESAISASTRVKEMIVQLKFDSEENGWISEETQGRKDTMLNAGLVPSLNEGLGSAIKFERTETIPGSGIWTNSAVYLDSAIWHLLDQDILGGTKATSPTELSYTFWFKNNDMALAKDPGSVMFVSGEHTGSAVGFFKDSIWVATATKLGPTVYEFKDGAPFADDGWHHLAFIYKEGFVQLYLDGKEIISYDEEGVLFWNRLSTRTNDHWAKTMIGACKWWHRPANGIFPENYGDNIWHNQFNGLMDELSIFSYAISEDEIMAQIEEVLPSVSSLEVSARGPNSVVLGMGSAEADTFVVTYKTGEEEYALAEPAQSTILNNIHFYLIDGLEEGTAYDFVVSAQDTAGLTGTGTSISASTRVREVMAQLKFDSEENGWISEETQGRTDTMLNASLVSSINESFGKAIKFERTETIPGSEIWTNSAVYLDSALWHLYDQDILGGTRATSPTELTYTFWFKNNDLALAKDPGSVMFVAGEHTGSAVGFYNDSIWVGTATKLGPTIFEFKDGAPFSDDGWHHLAFVYKEGSVQLYLDGQEIVSYNEEGNLFWNRLSTRTNDHWAKTMIGACKWWNRPANGIFPENYGDNLWHNQFNGLMDELTFYSYALSAQEITEQVAGVFPETPVVTAVAVSPNAVVLEVNPKDATSVKIESKAGSEDFAEVTPDKEVVHNGLTYYLIDGLVEETTYTMTVTGMNETGSSSPAELTAITPARELMIHFDFETESDGKVTDAITGEMDSLVNASLVASEFHCLGNAVRFEKTETVPGVLDQSTIYLDNSMMPYFNQVAGSPPVSYYSFTETSYAFWFKVEDADLAREGSILTSFGSSLSNGIALGKDSLFAGNAVKYGPDEFLTNDGVPFTSTDWTHVAWVFNQGVADIYIDGDKAFTLDHSADYFYQSMNVRYNDKWASNQLGGCFWYNRGLNPVTAENLGDKLWHHQFDGLMDDFRVYSYAITEADIDAIIAQSCVSVENTNVQKLKVYPNPATDILNFTATVNGNVKVYDISGKVLMEKELNNATALNIESLLQGVYYIRLYSNEDVFTTSFIKK